LLPARSPGVKQPGRETDHSTSTVPSHTSVSMAGKLYSCAIVFSCCSGYGGQQTCITYDAVNQAYIQARKRIRKYDATDEISRQLSSSYLRRFCRLREPQRTGMLPWRRTNERCGTNIKIEENYGTSQSGRRVSGIRARTPGRDLVGRHRTNCLGQAAPSAQGFSCSEVIAVSFCRHSIAVTLARDRFLLVSIPILAHPITSSPPTHCLMREMR
jgi:hypothetical protein